MAAYALWFIFKEIVIGQNKVGNALDSAGQAVQGEIDKINNALANPVSTIWNAIFAGTALEYNTSNSSAAPSDNTAASSFNGVGAGGNF